MIFLVAAVLTQDWPTLRGNVERTGDVQGALGSYRRAWVRHFAGERIGSAVEPIAGAGLVFAATHQGSVWALRQADGEPAWRFRARGAFLHSPAYSDGSLIAASADGRIYGLKASSGDLAWTAEIASGGFSASPAVVEGVAYIGSRRGEFVAVETGRTLWRTDLGAPVRQTAAISGDRIFVTAEDLKLRSLDRKTGKVVWTSEPLWGQSARDYYPVVAGNAVVVRTNPVVPMPERIARDRFLLCRTAGVDDVDWRAVEEWTRSDEAKGTPELREKEQAEILRMLRDRPEARSFFVIDAASGREIQTPPVLWIGGCQGSGTPPVATGDACLILEYRTAYGNWSLGVAPLVALGALDLSKNRIELFRHENGRAPPWNTFWGTADEAQNFLRVGKKILIAHQSTLSIFDPETKNLRALAGSRDGWGGLRNLPWARNEWNGPARGGPALAGKRIFWITGSRLHCFEEGEGPAAEDVEVHGVAEREAPQRRKENLKPRLESVAAEVVSKQWAPLYVSQGIGGPELLFADSAELFESLSWAYPELSEGLKVRVKEYLGREWKEHSPIGPSANLDPGTGERRELFRVPKDALARIQRRKTPHPFGGTYSAWLYATRLGEEERVRAAWGAIKDAYREFRFPEGEDLYANRYLASLRALGKLAERFEPGFKVDAAAAQDAIADWWKRAAAEPTPGVFRDVSQLDRFIGRGDLFSFRLAPHAHKIALFRDLSAEAAGEAPREAAREIWKRFQVLYATWPLVGEERQVHSGENYVDPPDLALGAFRACAWLTEEPLWDKVDEPFCRADLAFVLKCALALEARPN